MTTVDAERQLVDDAALWSLELWLTRVLPDYIGATSLETPDQADALFANHHRDFWTWVRSIETDVRPPEAFISIWSRGGAKSTSAELAVTAAGCTGRRRYVLYVCEIQDQSDDHVSNIATMLESDGVERFYPDMAKRLVGKFGNSKGWRRNRVRTATGFTVDAIGLDTASRGVKLEDQRPDMIVFDDIDGHEDSPRTVARKIRTITKALLPAGADDVAVMVIQNLVHRDGVVARLADGRAQMLARRIVSGPIPAVDGLVTEHQPASDEFPNGRDVIVAGEANWQGQDLDTCQKNIDEWGLVAFLEEAQHDVTSREGALWSKAQLAVRRGVCPVEALTRVVVAVDPSGGSGPDNDAQGIVVAGLDAAGDPWALDDLTCQESPAGWARIAIEAWRDWDADEIVGESNYGGDMVASTVRLVAEQMLRAGEIDRMPSVHLVTASKGKRVRAEPVAALYGRPKDEPTWSTARAHHVTGLVELEDEMTTWDPDKSNWSPNRLDALVWGFVRLLGITFGNGGRRRRRSVAS
jgi:hypothetical protein